MSDVAYRDACTNDCDALCDLMRATFCETFAHLYRTEDLEAFLSASYTPAQQYAEIIDPDVETRLAVQGGVLVGYAQIGPFRLPYEVGPGHALEVYRLYVRRSVQGRGVAPALMDWALTRMRERAAQDAFLGGWSQNERAKRFYARYGFERVGSYQFPVGETLDDEYILRARIGA